MWKAVFIILYAIAMTPIQNAIYKKFSNNKYVAYLVTFVVAAAILVGAWWILCLFGANLLN